MSWSRWESSCRADAWWTDREPRLGDLMALVGDLLAAGRRRLGATLLVSLLSALAAVVLVVVLRPDHAPRFVLRVVEPNADPTTLPRARRQLAEYVREGVLTSDVLLGVMERHGLNTALRRTNAPAAVESLREDVQIEVHQNYFLEERTVAEAPRSARLVLSFRSKDPDLALAVTRDLGRLVVAREQAARKQQAARALVEAETTLERNHRALTQHRAEITRRRAGLLYALAPDPLGEVELVGLLGSLEWRERELEKNQARKAALELGSTLEAQKLGLGFEVADEGSVRRAAELTALDLCAFGLGAFVCALPLALVSIGSFEPKRGVP